ncbi:MAG: hypothetical protein IPI90_10400 [Saprospiraceae bacterium]|nr:hypothetical protein [Candidatus Vicinibacter affinis]
MIGDRLMKITHVIRGEEWNALPRTMCCCIDILDGNLRCGICASSIDKEAKRAGKIIEERWCTIWFSGFPNRLESRGWRNFSGFREAGFLPGALINFFSAAWMESGNGTGDIFKKN